jgi:UDP-2,4-diacetamido-2,4,6-trideoxy-beta-L-altropyranose hydrolase
METTKLNELDWPKILELNQNSIIVFRVDSSAVIGAGHVMRCLTLAQEIRRSCEEIIFIHRELPGSMIDYIEDRGFLVYRIVPMLGDAQWRRDAEKTKDIIIGGNLKPDWLVVDDYGLDKRWESALRPLVKRIMVIDDLADREHDCDILLDQNYYRNFEIRYKSLVPADCRQLLGPKYALLRSEFKTARQSMRVRDGSIERILVFYGGSDPTNETAKALEAVKLLNRSDSTVDVVVGSANPHRLMIEEICSGMDNANFYCQVENMAELMAQADLALGAGGTATWERCYLGLSALVTIIAENQRETMEALAEDGVVWNLGWHEEVSVDQLVESLRTLLNNPDRIKEPALRGLALFEDCQKEKGRRQD